MINIKYILSLFVSLIFCLTLSGQSKSEIVSSATEVTYAKKLGTVNPVAKEKVYTEYDKEKLKLSRKDFKKPKNFTTRFPNNIINKDLEHTGPDKVRQSEIPVSKRPPIETVLNIEGLDNGNSPQDPSGDIGLDYYMQAVNASSIGIYTREGELIEEFRTNSLWSEFGVSPGGDPIILYDQEAHRWIITEFPAIGNVLLVAISQTSDPRGEYNAYRFSTPRFPDYPKYSIWPNAYCLTTNEANFNELHVYFINRQELIDGADNVTILRTSIEGPDNPEQRFIVATPVDWSGASLPPMDSNPMVLSLADASWTTGQSDDLINMTSFDIDWESENAVATLTQIPVSPYDSNPCAATGTRFQCIPQKDGQGLDGLPEFITFQPHYRNFGSHEAIVFNFITDATDGDNISGLRWIELRRSQGSAWSLYQEGTFAPDDGLHRFMGSIALDGQGNIGMAYSTSSDDTYASLRYTGRLAGDPKGLMTLEEQVAIEGSGAINVSGGRFGDYPHMTIDPVDNSTFWFTSEYAEGSESSTRILAFKVAKKEFDIGPTTLVHPQDSPDLGSNESVQIIVKNLGLNQVTEYKVGYQFDNGPIVEDVINSELFPDQTFQHTFAQTIDASQIGLYDLKIFTSYILDSQLLNDTIYSIIEKQARLDLGVFNISSAFPEICGTESEISYSLFNLGVDSIQNATIEIKVNGEIVDNFNYTDGLASGKSVELTTSIMDLNDGNNTIEISVSAPNGLLDELPSNNILTEDIEVLADGESIILELLTDAYPNETSWELLDEAGTVIYSSNGTLDGLQEQVLLTNFCLDPEECYTFVIYDDIGDGLASFINPSGSYQVYNSDGKILVGIINDDFGEEEANSFCVDFECNLEVEVLIEDAGVNQGGVIIAEVTNGAGPVFYYSIDGGTTFVESENIFDNLESGDYEVVVRDDFGCELTTNVTVGAVSSTKKLLQERNILISPNPTKGIVDIELSGLDSDDIWIPIDVFDSNGRKIQQTNITNYSGIYKGMLSLHHYPEGIYFIKFDFGDSHLLRRVIKQ